jgi:hypothetical protein
VGTSGNAPVDESSRFEIAQNHAIKLCLPAVRAVRGMPMFCPPMPSLGTNRAGR